MRYSYTNQIVIRDFRESTVEHFYDRGFLFTRLGRGVMNQVRSLRVNLKAFEPSSENRRVLRKTENVVCLVKSLPYDSYHWSVGKMAWEFYTTKFGEGTMSANKIKEMFTDPRASNMNAVFVYRLGAGGERSEVAREGETIGYCLAYQTEKMIHYSYPFYDLKKVSSSKIHVPGISMMTKAICWAQEHKKQYLYLGSVHDPSSLYKLQFRGLEWWDGTEWNTDIASLKRLLRDGHCASGMIS